jgi:hypothetical protein
VSDGPGDPSGAVLSFRNGFANGGRWGQTAADSGRKQDQYLPAFMLVKTDFSWSMMVPPAGFEPATHGLGNRCSIP